MASSPSSVHRWLRGSVIGVGSFGSVSLAINRDNGELFAVKSSNCSSDGAKANLLAMNNEISILQSLDSPWIVKCLGSDYSVENGVRVRNLFLEYMAGGSLADLMKKFGGHLDETLIRLYARSILEGLHYLHSQGVVHCDIKGKNILIGSSGVKIADFGSAKRLGSDQENAGRLLLADIGREKDSGEVSLKGTPLWMAPEVILQGEQGSASDIWSLGCTVVEMATGGAPWSKSLHLFVAFLQNGSSGDLPPLPDCLSAEGKDFLSKCFQRDPRARWTSEQLLEHPFVLRKTDNSHPLSARFKAPSSPTSILDFPGETSDWDSQPDATTSVPLLRLRRKMERARKGDVKSDADARISRDGKPSDSQPSGGKLENSLRSVTEGSPARSPSSGVWLTVRSNGGEEDRQKPLSSFMLQPLELAVAKAKSAAEVSFVCCDFLREKRHFQAAAEQGGASNSKCWCSCCCGFRTRGDATAKRIG